MKLIFIAVVKLNMIIIFNLILWYNCYLNLPTTVYYGICEIQDMALKTQINDPLLTHFYFNWTNFNFLPAFFTLGLLTHILFFLKKIQTFNTILTTILILILYNFELFDTLTLNSALVYSNFGTEFINYLLANSLNKYHPYIFYTSLWIYINTLVTTSLQLSNRNYFYKTQILINLRLYTIAALWLNFTALFMGSWWAFQEGTWGGWWNWDSSEVFGLSVGLFLLLNIHLKLNLRKLYLLVFEYRIFLAWILLFYSFIQINFELASHNFGSKYHFFNNNNLLLMQHSLFSVIYSYFFLWKNIQYHTTVFFISKPLTTPKWTELNYFSLLFWFVISSWFAVSFTPLISHFSWNFLQISVFNSDLSPKFVNTLLTVMFILITQTVLYSLPSENFLVYIITTVYALPTLHSLRFDCWKIINFIHISLLLIFYVNTLTLDPEFVEWDFTNTGFMRDRTITLNLKNWTVNNLNYVISSTWFDLNLTLNNSWLSYQEGNTSSMNQFVLVSNYTGTLNFYSLGTSYLFSHLYLTSYWLDLLNALTICLLIGIFTYLLHLTNNKMN